MAEPMDTPDTPATESVYITDEERELRRDDDDNNLLAQIEKTYQLWWRWADFHLFIVSPTLPINNPPVIIPPELLPGSDELEFVYPIHDHGYKLSASKGQDIYLTGLSMCKLYYTIEKMMFILVERIKSSGGNTETEVLVAFDGHELAQRKCFESIINLSYNVVVTNFNPGAWGERYLQVTKHIADKGYGYPASSPRDPYRKSHAVSMKIK